MKSIALLILLSLPVCFSLSFAAEAEPLIVAIAPLEHTGPDDNQSVLGEVLANLLMQSLSGSYRFIMVERVELEAILTEQSVSGKGYALQGARALCTGSFSVKDGDLHLVVRLIDIADSKILSSASESGVVADLDLVLRRATKALRQDRQPHAATEAKGTKKPEELHAELNYAKGLGEYWLGNYPAAVAYFSQSLKGRENPAVRYWLAVGYKALGLPVSARLELHRLEPEKGTKELVEKAKLLDEICAAGMSVTDRQVFKRLIDTGDGETNP